MVKFFLLFFILFSVAFPQTESLFKLEPSENNFLPTINITIGGDFVYNGTFSAFPGERVDKLVSTLYNEVFSETPTNQLWRIKIPLRGIVLKRFSGEEIQIDLLKFRLTGDFKYNPFLENDDVIIFPYRDEDLDLVYIGGAVTEPKLFQFEEGDKLEDAILFAGGLNKAYENLDTVFISRLSLDGNKEEILISTIENNPILQRGDRVTIVGKEPERKFFFVQIIGEVNSPGIVPITKTTTNLKTVIERAGGFTLNADLDRAELIRGAGEFSNLAGNKTEQEELLDRLMMERMADISVEDSLIFLTDNKLRFNRSTGVLDFNNLENPESEESNFIVKHLDRIVIPEKIDLVYLYGQVNKPGYIKYEDGKQYKFYIERAGGVSKQAKDEIYHIDGKTRSWTLLEDDTILDIKPGDFIWVPKERPKSFSYYLERTTAIAGVVSAVATILLLVNQLSK